MPAHTDAPRTIDIDLRGLLSTSLNEWEGRVSAVVFTARCNWQCPYCHGWRLVNEPDALEPFSVDDVFSLLAKRGDWLDGVVITGGEPTLWPGLTDLIRCIKQTHPVKLETNGTRPEVIKGLLDENLLDCLCMDYKAPLDERLWPVLGIDPNPQMLEAVQESYALARKANTEREFHTTLCPAFLDENTIADMARMLNQPGALWVLQQYEPDDVLNASAAGFRQFDMEELHSLEAIAMAGHDRVLLRSGRTA